MLCLGYMILTGIHPPSLAILFCSQYNRLVAQRLNWVFLKLIIFDTTKYILLVHVSRFVTIKYESLLNNLTENKLLLMCVANMNYG
jgi:hypothetical protein